MKTKMKRQGSTELPRFAVGALAIAGASAANGATVQITFTGSYIATTGDISLVTDFGGDGVADLGGNRFGTKRVRLFGPPSGAAGYLLWGSAGYALDYLGLLVAKAVVGGITQSGDGSTGFRGLAPVAFSDGNIRNGTQTNGLLDITAVAHLLGEKRLTVHRLIFDDASTTAPTGLTSASTGIPEWQVSAVPEPGSRWPDLAPPPQARGLSGLTRKS
jgi:hypothetical protein